MGKTTEYPVKSLISFDALENPSWQITHTNERQPKTVTEMITQIKEYYTRWEQVRAENTFNEDLVKKVSVFNAKYGHFHAYPVRLTTLRDTSLVSPSMKIPEIPSWSVLPVFSVGQLVLGVFFLSLSLYLKVKQQFLFSFIYHVNVEEGHGLTTLEETEAFLLNCSSRRNSASSFSLEEQETINLRAAYENLLAKINKEEQPSDYGLMEVSLLEETHRLILQDIPLPKGFTKPGRMSNNVRVTEFKGELYHYANPEDMESAVSNLLDKYNFLFDSCTKDEGKLEDFDDFYSLFKTCAWLLFELLDLHPFGNGNGRLCRILCSYALSKLNPFPTPVYDVWTESCKDDYRQALVDARKSEGRQPAALTTMIIECTYYGWGKFFEA